MAGCEKNCNPEECLEPVCEPGVRELFYSWQIALACPKKEFNGNRKDQAIHVVTTCRKEVQVKRSDGASEKRIQRCQLPCPVGKELDIFVAEKNH